MWIILSNNAWSFCWFGDRFVFFFRVALKTPAKCLSIRLLKGTGTAHTLHGRRNLTGSKKDSLSLLFLLLFFFLKGCLKQNKKFLNITAKLLQGIKDYHSACPHSSPPPSFDFCVLSDNAFGDGGLQLIPIISAFCLVFEIEFSENAFDSEQYPHCQNFQSTLVQKICKC